MRNRGVSNPARNMAICGVVGVAGIVAVAAGALEMRALGHETGRTAGLIALGLFSGILGIALCFNFWRAVRIVNDMRSGRTAIARWTLLPQEFDRFRVIDRRFAEREEDNDYKVPRTTPPDGVDVIFSDDGVLIGGVYFGLATTGIGRFDNVRWIGSDPPMIEFGTVLTTATNLSVVHIRHIHGTLRVPVAVSASQQGDHVARRFRDVIERRVIVKPYFWTARLRAGLWIAGVFVCFAAVGLALRARNQELANIPLVLAVAGTIIAIGGLVIAFLAWALRRRQRGG